MTLATILIVLAMVLYGLAAFLWPPFVEPYRLRLVAAGLFCTALAQMIGGLRL